MHLLFILPSRFDLKGSSTKEAALQGVNLTAGEDEAVPDVYCDTSGTRIHLSWFDLWEVLKFSGN